MGEIHVLYMSVGRQHESEHYGQDSKKLRNNPRIVPHHSQCSQEIKGLSEAGDLTLSLNAFETGLPCFATTAVVVFLMWYSEKLNIPYF